MVLGHQHPGPTPRPSTGSPRTPQSTASAFLGWAPLRAQLPEAPSTAVSADPLLRGHILSCLAGQEAIHLLLTGRLYWFCPITQDGNQLPHPQTEDTSLQS